MDIQITAQLGTRKHQAHVSVPEAPSAQFVANLLVEVRDHIERRLNEHLVTERAKVEVDEANTLGDDNSDG